MMPSQPDAWICLSGTSYQDQHNFADKLGDFLFAWERAAAERLSSVIELKSGSWNVSHVHQQLQNGATIIDDLLRGIEVNFLPALVYKGMPTVEQRQLPRYQVSFRGKKHRIALLRCGSKVADLRW
jgi:hypothetical protein